MIGPQLPPEGLPKAQQEDGEQHSSYDSFSSSATHAGLQQAARIVDVTELRPVCKLQMGAGLQNLGNSCYMNSVLQCLAYIPPVVNAYQLKRLHGFSYPCPLKRKGLACTGCLIEHQLDMQTKGSRTVPIRPHALHSHLQLFSKAFLRGRQEDAHEFLLSVLDAIERDCKRALALLGHSKASRTLVEQLFHGQLQNQVRCSACGHVSSTPELLTTLSLDLHNTDTVEGSLAQYMAEEILDGDNKYKCDKCNKLVRARKWVDVKKEPNVLVIHLKRFNAWTVTSKISRHIKFSHVLRLRQPCTPSEAPGNPAQYMLFGVVVHSGGSVHSGHYVAYVRDSTGKWWCANDGAVYQVQPDVVLKQQAYLLFYSRTSTLVPWPDEPSPLKRQRSTPIALTATTGGMSSHSPVGSPPANTPRAVFGPALPHDARHKAQPATDVSSSYPGTQLPTASSPATTVTTASVTKLGAPVHGKVVLQLKPMQPTKPRQPPAAVVKASLLSPAGTTTSPREHHVSGNGHDNGHALLPAAEHAGAPNGVSKEQGRSEQGRKRAHSPVRNLARDGTTDSKRPHISATLQQLEPNSNGKGHDTNNACSNGNHQQQANGNVMHKEAVSNGKAAVIQQQVISRHADGQQPELQPVLRQVVKIVSTAYKAQPGYLDSLRELVRQQKQLGLTLDEVLRDEALKKQARLPIKDLQCGNAIKDAGSMIEAQMRKSL